MTERSFAIKTRQKLARIMQAEPLRYIINGVVATAVHFGVLVFNMQVLQLPSAGIANLIAALFGITTSFLGSRYFVFKKREDPILKQAIKFSSLYIAIACLHGLLLFIWGDIYHLDYRIGFVFATILQMLLSYFGNKILVFNK